MVTKKKLAELGASGAGAFVADKADTKATLAGKVSKAIWSCGKPRWAGAKVSRASYEWGADGESGLGRCSSDSEEFSCDVA